MNQLWSSRFPIDLVDLIDNDPCRLLGWVIFSVTLLSTATVDLVVILIKCLSKQLIAAPTVAYVVTGFTAAATTTGPPVSAASHMQPEECGIQV